MDPQLGYPRGYAKLCRHAFIQPQGLITPFTLGPPQRFLPYTPQADEMSKLRVYEDLFPVVDEENRDFSNPDRHIDILWQQLDHLENAGFDPDKFRIDAYGNVLYRDADPGSPLSWEMDYWFPHSRGGKSILSNLRLVQWQVSQRRREKLEFLVPWWDLQLGVSVNQFLAVFSSENNEFRQRALSLFFLDGEDEQIGDKSAFEMCSEPNQSFREHKNRDGFAAASIVLASKRYDSALRSLNTNIVATRPLPMDKENKTYFSAASAIEAEHKWRESLKEAKKQRVEEVSLMEAELRDVKEQNLKEKSVIEQLEITLSKHKKRVEKQRKWSETQSQYRICLEKMIRDTVHQCVVYKQQTKLNHAACNALLARLESQKTTCDAAEMELVRKIKEREELEASVRPKITKRSRHHGNTDVGSLYVKPDKGEKLNKMQEKIGACAEPSLSNDKERYSAQDCEEGYGSLSKGDDGSEGSYAMERVANLVGSSGMKRKALEVSGELDVVLLGYEYDKDISEKEGSVGVEESVGDNGSLQENSREDRKWQLSVVSGEGSNNEDAGSNNYCDNYTCSNDVIQDDEDDNGHDIDDYEDDDAERSEQDADEEPKKKIDEEEEVEDLLEEVLEMQGKVKEAMVEAILEEDDEGERVKKLGKLNLDQWLQNLLLDSGYGVNGGGYLEQYKEKEKERSSSRSLDVKKVEEEVGRGESRGKEAGLEAVKVEQGRRQSTGGTGQSTGGGIIGGLLRKLNMKNNAGSVMGSEHLTTSTSKLAVDTMRESRRLSMGDVVKKLGGSVGSGGDGDAQTERRSTSPWRRWPSPVVAFRRSSSAGCEARRPRGRRIPSPWRRNPEPAPTTAAAEEQRKVIESFSKLKLAAANSTQRGKDEEEREGKNAVVVASTPVPVSPPAPRRQSVAILQRAIGSGGRASVKAHMERPKHMERSRSMGSKQQMMIGERSRAEGGGQSNALVLPPPPPLPPPRRGDRDLGGVVWKDSMMMMKQRSRHATGPVAAPMAVSAPKHVPGRYDSPLARGRRSPPPFFHRMERRSMAGATTTTTTRVPP